MRAPWPAFSLSIALLLAGASRAAAQTVRESESSRGLVRIAVVPVEGAGGAGSDSAGKSPSLEAIEDFTALSRMPRHGEALLEIYFLDHATGEELRFPIKYSELRRHLRRNPLRYQEGSLDERTVSMVGDLARSLRIRMKEPGEEAEKP